MKNLVLVLPIILVIGNFMLGCTPKNKHEEGMGATQEQTTEPQQETSVSYTCPMHPEVVSDKPAEECPKCGMNLVEKK